MGYNRSQNAAEYEALETGQNSSWTAPALVQLFFINVYDDIKHNNIHIDRCR